MEENLSNFFMGYFLERPPSQGFNVNFFQRLGLSLFKLWIWVFFLNFWIWGWAWMWILAWVPLNFSQGLKLVWNCGLMENSKWWLICGKRSIGSIEGNLWLQKIGKNLSKKSKQHSLMKCHAFESSVKTKSPRWKRNIVKNIKHAMQYVLIWCTPKFLIRPKLGLSYSITELWGT